MGCTAAGVLGGDVDDWGGSGWGWVWMCRSGDVDYVVKGGNAEICLFGVVSKSQICQNLDMLC